MKKGIILSCLAFITLSALGLNAYLSQAKKMESPSKEVPLEKEVSTTVAEAKSTDSKKADPMRTENSAPKITETKKETIKNKSSENKKKTPKPMTDKKELEVKVKEEDLPAMGDVLMADSEDSALSIPAEEVEAEENVELRELAIEHFSRASLKQPSEKHLKKSEKLMAKASKKEARKSKKKLRK